MATLNVSRYGGTITINATSEPSSNTKTLRKGSNSNYATISNNVVTLTENTGASDRSFSLSATVTTATNAQYDGTATAWSAWTVNQYGTGSTPVVVDKITIQWSTGVINNDSDSYAQVSVSSVGIICDTTAAELGTSIEGTCGANQYGGVLDIGGETTYEISSSQINLSQIPYKLTENPVQSPYGNSWNLTLFFNTGSAAASGSKYLYFTNYDINNEKTIDLSEYKNQTVYVCPVLQINES